MTLLDVIEDRVSHVDAIFVCVFLQGLLVVIERQEVLVQPTRDRYVIRISWIGLVSSLEYATYQSFISKDQSESPCTRPHSIMNFSKE